MQKSVKTRNLATSKTCIAHSKVIDLASMRRSWRIHVHGRVRRPRYRRLGFRVQGSSASMHDSEGLLPCRIGGVGFRV